MNIKSKISLLKIEFIGIINVPCFNGIFNFNDSLSVINSKNDISIFQMGHNFTNLLSRTDEYSSNSFDVAYYEIKSSCKNDMIMHCLRNDELVFTSLYAINYLLRRQPNGQRGVLITNGYANIFYVHDMDGEIHLIYCLWSGKGWVIHSKSIKDKHEWYPGRRVFSKC